MNEFEKVLNTDVVARLDDYGLIKVEGDDAETFLHAQFTNDLQQGVSENSSQLSAYCSPKGRILSLFRIYKANNAFYLSMPRELIEATHKRLSMFVLMSKVTLTDETDNIHQLGVSGPNSEQKLMALVGQPPETVDQVVTNENISIIRIPGPHPRFQIIGPAKEIKSLNNKLGTFVAEVSANAWQLLDIHAAIPIIKLANVEAFVPQMINLQAINGLSFKKGCYPGQEVVARMQYLGKLKRRMYLAHSDNDAIAEPGDNIFVNVDEPRKTGVVVTAQPAPDGGCDLLIVVEIESAENQPLHLDGNMISALSLKPLPYSLEPLS